MRTKGLSAGLALVLGLCCSACDTQDPNATIDPNASTSSSGGSSAAATSDAPATAAELSAPDPEADLPAATRQRIDDLVAIAAALEAYRADNGKYPDSGGAYAAYKISWGNSKGETWIPELVPDYLQVVPRDPAKSEDPDGPQYLYASDGAYFKIIAHYTGDCETAIKSPRVKRDPVRTNPDGSCWAYGLWSPEGERF